MGHRNADVYLSISVTDILLLAKDLISLVASRGAEKGGTDCLVDTISKLVMALRRSNSKMR